MDEAEVAPIVIAARLPGNDLVNDDFRRFIQRHSGDGASVILPLEKMRPPLACVGDGSAEQGLFPPLIPVFRQPWAKGTVRPFDLIEAEPVEALVGKESDPVARRSVRRGHREFLSIHPRQVVVGSPALAGRGARVPDAVASWASQSSGPGVDDSEAIALTIWAFAVHEGTPE